jgi:hypothetical protein
MDDPLRFSSTSHLVGHLIREIESSLRDVLQPLAQEAGAVGEMTKEDKEEKHKFQIRSILTLLDIPLDDEVAKHWLSQAGTYHSKAHREALNAPRPLEASLADFFDDFEGILDYVLNRMEANYAWVFVRVDALAAKSPVSDADVGLLLGSFPQDAVALGRFFERASEHSWLPLLRQRGMYDSPPEPELHQDEGTVSFPPWPQMQLLIRFAAELPDEVVDTVQQIPPTDNELVNAAIADVAKALPIDKVPELLPRLTMALTAKYHMVFPARLADLIGKLVDAGYNDAALDLVREMLAFDDPPMTAEGEPNEFVRSLREPLLRVDQYLFVHILEGQMPRLIDAVGIGALDLLATLLETAIIVSSSDEMTESHQDFSSTWCPAVTPSGVSYDHGIKMHLTSALRNGTVAHANTSPQDLRSLVEGLEARQWSIFRRLSLNVLRFHGAQDVTLVEERLVDPVAFADAQLRPEYEGLLAAHFARLSKEGQLAILTLIENQPDVARHDKWFRETHGREPTADEQRSYVEMQILNRLTPIADQLPEQWKVRYDQYVAAHGPRQSLETMTGWGYVSDRSPSTPEELAALDDDTLIDYLSSFEPGDFLGPSKAGLAKTFAEVVTTEPNRYLPLAERLATLDIEYVSAILTALNQVVTSGADLDWDGALTLCETVVRHPRTATDGTVPDSRWGWARLDVLRLISTGFGSAHPLQPEHEARVFAIIESVTDDPHPTPDDEEQYGPPNMSPEDLSLNSVRSRAIETAVEYGVWKYLRDPNSSFDDVIAIVERHLDPEVDPSVAVRSVLGRNFSNLIAFDHTWAAGAAERIFPADEGLRHLWTAAWDSHLWRGLRNKPTWLALQNQYAVAVKRVEPGSDERHQRGRDKSLGNHLSNLYWSGEVGLDEGLLADFLQVADEGLRQSVLENVGRGLSQAGPPLVDAVLARIICLWNSRVAAVRSEPSGELSAYGWWFCSDKIPADARFQGLRDALALSGHVEPAHQVVEHLATLSPEYPRETAELLGLMAERESDGWRFTLWDESAAQIIRTAVASGDVEALRFAREAVSRAAARGHSQWLDFLADPSSAAQLHFPGSPVGRTPILQGIRVTVANFGPPM